MFQACYIIIHAICFYNPAPGIPIVELFQGKGMSWLRIEKVYLFGSYAHGTYREDSDIDIAIVSKDFTGDRFADRRRVVPLRRKIDRRLEPIPYIPENFKENDPLVMEILKNGIEIK